MAWVGTRLETFCGRYSRHIPLLILRHPPTRVTVRGDLLASLLEGLSPREDTHPPPAPVVLEQATEDFYRLLARSVVRGSFATWSRKRASDMRDALNHDILAANDILPAELQLPLVMSIPEWKQVVRFETRGGGVLEGSSWRNGYGFLAGSGSYGLQGPRQSFPDAI